ncbi:hypothetical protein [Marinicella rhabdoformis]|uniref:hypothetical protein n=1 Tax=Marinicella rhabdoformis TaxID=2580566 RepID=UPI0012AED859|nr:hypothetical protein [Marinicella rhabdoformis]
MKPKLKIKIVIFSILISVFQFPAHAAQHNVTISLSGNGSGVVTSNPLGVNCGDECSYSFDEGEAVILIPTRSDDSEFIGWLGDDDCLDGIITVLTDLNCQAIFDIWVTNRFSIIKSTGSGGLQDVSTVDQRFALQALVGQNNISVNHGGRYEIQGGLLGTNKSDYIFSDGFEEN